MQPEDDCYYNDSLHTPKFVTEDFYECTGCGMDFSEEEYKQFIKDK